MTLKRIALYYIPPILWMIFIFLLSSRQQISVSETFIFDFIIFKSLHVIEYAILYFLLLRAFYISTPRASFTYALIFALMYSISDEIHQTFVPTREGSIRDVFVDLIGITAAFIFLKKNIKKLGRLF